MIKIAGKYARNISKNPFASTLAGGLAAAGMSALGNVIDEQADEKEPARLVAEAAGAGALGAIAGSMIPRSSTTAARVLKGLGAVSYSNSGAQARRASMTPAEIQSAINTRNQLAALVKNGANPREVSNALKDRLRLHQTASNAGLPLSLAVAAGVGSALGGGVSNLANAVGIPQFAERIDPESYGSSNSPGAQYKTPTNQYM